MERAYFNPRSLTGATPIKLFRLHFLKISIHAPLRERPKRQRRKVEDCHFNPRSLTGATIVEEWKQQHPDDFNPRSLTGATIGAYDRSHNLRFQSTLPYGSDAFPSSKCPFLSISIHAPLRERPSVFTICFSSTQISIHAPLRERPVTNV